MKPTGQSKRPKDWLPFVNFAMLKGVPGQVRLREHLFPYEGVQPDERFIWGVYGTTSINAAIFSASHFAQEQNSLNPSGQEIRSLQITTWFRIDDFKEVPSQLTPKDVSDRGYLHLGRVSSAYREDLRKRWIAWIALEEGVDAASLESWHLEELAERCPQFVRKLLEDSPSLHAVIHPVQQIYQKSRIPLWMLTARYDRSRLMASEARFAPMVKVEV